MTARVHNVRRPKGASPAQGRSPAKPTTPNPQAAKLDADSGDIDRSTRRADQVDVAIAQRLRAAREQAGLTQHEFAAQLDVSYQQLQKYERGINRISGSVLYRSAALLGITASELFPEAEVAVRSDAAPSGRKSPRMERGDAPTSHVRALGELEDFADICDRILKLQSPRLRRALLAVVQQSVEGERA